MSASEPTHTMLEAMISIAISVKGDLDALTYERNVYHLALENLRQAIKSDGHTKEQLLTMISIALGELHK